MLTIKECLQDIGTYLGMASAYSLVDVFILQLRIMCQGNLWQIVKECQETFFCEP